MPICPKCRTGYDDAAACPKCGAPVPEKAPPARASVDRDYRCSLFGVFCILFAWVSIGALLGLHIFKSFRDVSGFEGGVLAVLSALIHLGICYALWLAFRYATNRDR